MLSATLYVAACSMKNRTLRWLRRLREPRYAIGLVLAIAYFYFTIVARMGRARRPGRRGVSIYDIIPSMAGVAPHAAGVALLAAAALSWLTPTSGRLLDFPDAEVDFLFTAPVHRRDLLIHRLVRAQGGLLFAALIPVLPFAFAAGSAVLAARGTLALWLLFIAARVYFSAIALSRSQLASPDPRLRRLARLPLVIVLVAVAIVAAAAARAYAATRALSFDEVSAALAAALSTGGARVVLWPFVALARPLFAAGWGAFVETLLQSAIVCAAAMAWLIGADEAFQASAAAAAEAIERRPAARGASYAARPPAWQLAPTGRPETAFVWKSITQMLRVVDRRVIIRAALILTTLAALVTVSSRDRAIPGIAGLFATFGAAYAVLLAPQILRLDMRQDLQHLELMKTWPVRGAAIVRGEITGPALALTALTWILIALALLFSGEVFPRTALAWRAGFASGAALLAPGLIFGQYAVHNGFALMFPGWVPLGAGRARGLDAMGQRLLTLGGTWILLALMLVPGALVSAVLWLAFHRVAGAALLPICGSICAVAIALEILMMTEALGPAYERLDLLAIERPA